ncbi:MAG: hypothetical protein AAF363_15675 [Bacteroidota bacterium]
MQNLGIKPIFVNCLEVTTSIRKTLKMLKEIALLTDYDIRENAGQIALYMQIDNAVFSVAAHLLKHREISWFYESELENWSESYKKEREAMK